MKRLAFAPKINTSLLPFTSLENEMINGMFKIDESINVISADLTVKLLYLYLRIRNFLTGEDWYF